MPAPTVEEAEAEEEPEADEETDDLDGGPSTDGDVPDVEEVELQEDDLGSPDPDSDLFTGSDDVSSTETSSSGSDDEEDDDEDTDPLDALGARGESMESAVNEGAARLAVVGLDETDREDLEDEFVDVFEAFRLGYFGSRAMEEYVFISDDEEVDPIWGLLGSMIICTAFVVWMRPDGEEKVSQARDAIENMAGGI